MHSVDVSGGDQDSLTYRDAISSSHEKQRRLKERLERDSLYEKRREFLALRNSHDPNQRAEAAKNICRVFVRTSDAMPLFVDSDERVRLAVARAVLNYWVVGNMTSNMYRQSDFPKYMTRNLLKDTSSKIRQFFASKILFINAFSPEALGQDVIKSYLTDSSEDVRAEMARWWWYGLGQVELAKSYFFDNSPRVRRLFLKNPGSKYLSEAYSRS